MEQEHVMKKAVELKVLICALNAFGVLNLDTYELINNHINVLFNVTDDDMDS